MGRPCGMCSVCEKRAVRHVLRRHATESKLGDLLEDERDLWNTRLPVG